MHAPHFRLFVANETGSDATVTIKYRGKKFDANGELAYAAEATLLNAATITTGQNAQSTAVDNTAEKNLEGEIDILVDTVGQNPNGDVTVLLQRSIDGTNWPDADAGELASTLNITSAATNRRVVNIA